MKFLLIGLIALTSISAFAYELKEGKAFAGYTTEEPELIQISLRDEAAELTYRKLKIKAVRTSEIGGFETFEKNGDSVNCSKIVVAGKSTGFECKIMILSSGVAIRP